MELQRESAEEGYLFLLRRGLHPHRQDDAQEHVLLLRWPHSPRSQDEPSHPPLADHPQEIQNHQGGLSVERVV